MRQFLTAALVSFVAFGAIAEGSDSKVAIEHPECCGVAFAESIKVFDAANNENGSFISKFYHGAGEFSRSIHGNSMFLAWAADRRRGDGKINVLKINGIFTFFPNRLGAGDYIVCRCLSVVPNIYRNKVNAFIVFGCWNPFDAFHMDICSKFLGGTDPAIIQSVLGKDGRFLGFFHGGAGGLCGIAGGKGGPPSEANRERTQYQATNTDTNLFTTNPDDLIRRLRHAILGDQILPSAVLLVSAGALIFWGGIWALDRRRRWRRVCGASLAFSGGLILFGFYAGVVLNVLRI